MTKKATVKRKPKAAKVVAEEKAKDENVGVSFSLTQLYYDIDTIKMQMEIFTDNELYEFCLHHIDMYGHKEMDRLYPKISNGSKLNPKERASLEAFCILANTELCLSV